MWRPALSRQGRASALAAEQKYRLLPEQVPEPPGGIEPQRLAPGIERHRPLHLHADLGAQLHEILDGAVVDIGLQLTSRICG
jgi:hypothetical protein